jgi:adenosylhomocysteine nucleosidase
LNSSGVVIVCALPLESAAILAGLGRAGFIDVIAAGMGPHSAGALAREIANRKPKPELVLSAGFCGALQDDLNVGDTVICDEIIDADSAATLSHPRAAECAQVFQNRLSESGTAVRRGVLLGTSTPVFSSAQKRALGQRFKALAVDMESVALARELHAQRIPVLVVRAVSDAAGDELPPETGEFLTPAGQPRTLRILRYLLGGPSKFKTLLLLKRHSDAAAKTLTTVFTTLRGSLGGDRYEP